MGWPVGMGGTFEGMLDFASGEIARPDGDSREFLGRRDRAELPEDIADEVELARGGYPEFDLAAYRYRRCARSVELNRRSVRCQSGRRRLVRQEKQFWLAGYRERDDVAEVAAGGSADHHSRPVTRDPGTALEHRPKSALEEMTRNCHDHVGMALDRRAGTMYRAADGRCVRSR